MNPIPPSISVIPAFVFNGPVRFVHQEAEYQVRVEGGHPVAVWWRGDASAEWTRMDNVFDAEQRVAFDHAVLRHRFAVIHGYESPASVWGVSYTQDSHEMIEFECVGCARRFTEALAESLGQTVSLMVLGRPPGRGMTYYTVVTANGSVKDPTLTGSVLAVFRSGVEVFRINPTGQTSRSIHCQGSPLRRAATPVKAAVAAAPVKRSDKPACGCCQSDQLQRQRAGGKVWLRCWNCEASGVRVDEDGGVPLPPVPTKA